MITPAAPFTSCKSLPSVAFLDRDGTIIEDRNYISKPDDVVLLPQAAEAIAHLNEMNIPVVVITNQSGIGRGYFSIEQYNAVHNRMIDLLSESGARIDATYLCPHAPSDSCNCRKPGSGMFIEALEALNGGTDNYNFNPAFIGDKWRDISQSLRMGGSAFLIDHSSSHQNRGVRVDSDDLLFASKYATIVPSLFDAVEIITTSEIDSESADD